MQLNLKLSHKGWILVLVPLVFCLLFIGVLSFMLTEVEQEAERAAHSKAVMTASEDLSGQLFAMVPAVANFAIYKRPEMREHYRQMADSTVSKIAYLEKLVVDDPNEVLCVKRMEHLANRGFSDVDGILNSVEAGGIVSLTNVQRWHERLQALTNLFMREAKLCVEIEKNKHLTDPDRATHWRLRVKYFLVFGIAMTLLLSLFLPIYFYKAISLRLSLITDNALRLASKAPLNPMVDGENDEIAQLDELLHRVALVLEEATQRERAIIDNAVDVICSLDARNKFVQVSEASSRVWGYETGELTGSRLLDIVVPEDIDVTLEATKSIAQGRSASSFENRVKCKDGSIINVLWSAYWSETEKSLFCIAHDITDRKSAEGGPSKYF